MPPRAKKTTQAKPDPEAEQEELDAPAEEARAEQSDAAKPEPTKSDSAPVELPCPVCFADGWPDGVTARGCEHGTWQRQAAG